MPTVTINTPILPVEPLLRAIRNTQYAGTSYVAARPLMFGLLRPEDDHTSETVTATVRRRDVDLGVESVDIISNKSGLGDLIRRYLLRSGADVPDDITESLAYEAAERTLLRATSEKGGLLTRGWVDDFCCTYLQVHPCAVYGEAWFDFSEEYLAQGARPDRYEDRPRRTARANAGEKEVA